MTMGYINLTKANELEQAGDSATAKVQAVQAVEHFERLVELCRYEDGDTILTGQEKRVCDGLNYTALSYLKLGEVAKAINTFSKLVEVDPAYLNAYYYMAVKSNELKKYDETLRYAREALNYVTDNNMRYSLLSIMGRIYYRQKKDYQNAIETYTKALPLAPAQSKMIVLLFRGLSHYDLGQRMDYSNDEDADMDELIDQGKMTTRRAGQASGYYEKSLLDLNKVTGRYAKNAKAHINNIAQLKRRLEKIKQQIAYYEKTK